MSNKSLMNDWIKWINIADNNYSSCRLKRHLSNTEPRKQSMNACLLGSDKKYTVYVNWWNAALHVFLSISCDKMSTKKHGMSCNVHAVFSKIIGDKTLPVVFGSASSYGASRLPPRSTSCRYFVVWYLWIYPMAHYITLVTNHPYYCPSTCCGSLRTWYIYHTSNGSWCMGIKGEMSGTVCVTFTWYMYIYELSIAFVCFVVCSLL